MERCRELKAMLYDDMKAGIVSKQDYTELHGAYEARRREAESAIRNLKTEIENILSTNTDKYGWLEYFKEYKDIEKLTRNVAVELIREIKVIDKKELEIVFDFDDAYRQTLEQICSLGYHLEDGIIRPDMGKEAV